MKTIHEVAIAEARRHAKLDAELDKQLIKAFWSPDTNCLRLLEVTTAVSGNEGTMYSFAHKAAPKQGVPYEMEIVLLNPEEWKTYEEGKMSLPRGWSGELVLLLEDEAIKEDISKFSL